MSESSTARDECTNMNCHGEAEYAYWMPDLGQFSRVRSPEHDMLDDGDLAPYVCESCRDHMAGSSHWDESRFYRPEEKLVTDGGQVELPDNEFICHPNTRTLHRGTREDGAECGQPDSEGWAKVDAENPMDAVLNYATQPCSKCFKTGYHDLKRVYLSEHTAVACLYETEEVLEESQWSVDTETDHSGGDTDE